MDGQRLVGPTVRAPTGGLTGPGWPLAPGMSGRPAPVPAPLARQPVTSTGSAEVSTAGAVRAVECDGPRVRTPAERGRFGRTQAPADPRNGRHERHRPAGRRDPLPPPRGRPEPDDGRHRRRPGALPEHRRQAVSRSSRNAESSEATGRGSTTTGSGSNTSSSSPASPRSRTGEKWPTTWPRFRPS